MKRWLYGTMIVVVGGAMCALITRQIFVEQLPFPYVDFDISMKTDVHRDKLTAEWGKPLMEIFKLLYLRYNAQHVTREAMPRIPNIIHQIWLGGQLPEKYHAWQQSWITYHPTWEYHLWTDNDIEKLHALGDFFIGDTYRYYQEATNYGERSDILKILLIYYFGGLYVDTDFECLQPCDVFHHCYDMYLGIQPMDVAYVQLGYALFGAYPRHPLIRTVIDALHTTRHIPEIVCRTGPLLLTRCFAEHALRTPGRTIALPASYFYPRDYNDPLEPRSAWVKPESYAVHHWAGSWLAPEANVK